MDVFVVGLFAVAGGLGFEGVLDELLNGKIFFNMPRMRLPPPAVFSALCTAWLSAGGEPSELESFGPGCCRGSVSCFKGGDKMLSNDRNVLEGMT